MRADGEEGLRRRTARYVERSPTTPALIQLRQTQSLHVLFGQTQMVADLVAQRDLNLIDQVVLVAADLLEVALEEHHARHVGGLRGLLGLRAGGADVDSQDL